MRVEAGYFEVVYEAARACSDRIRNATSPFTYDGEDETFYYLTADRTGGFCVRSSGELVFVFSTVPGQGDMLVRAAVERGATHLDCFDGYLPTLYARHGFGETRREPNWDAGGPDVIYMHR